MLGFHMSQFLAGPAVAVEVSEQHLGDCTHLHLPLPCWYSSVAKEKLGAAAKTVIPLPQWQLFRCSLTVK